MSGINRHSAIFLFQCKIDNKMQAYYSVYIEDAKTFICPRAGVWSGA